ncbi:MAG: MBL fold metallo-hydrolase [Eubacteriales bacterium]|nr:MBL fold metallo-hydrolase [Eubacteriales bacterium]
MKVSRKKTGRVGIGILALVLIAAGVYLYCQKEQIDPAELLEAQPLEDDGNLRIYFLDVGQGSAALAKVNGKYMLIDGGGPDTAKNMVSYLEEMGVEDLDYILICDYEEAHLAGVVEVLKNYTVSHVLSPDCTKDTEIYQEYQRIVEENEVEVLHPNLGEIYAFGNTFFTIVGPVFYGHEDGRNDSLCIRLDYGDTDFLFCGDTEEVGETEMAGESLENMDIDLQADVYVVNNHGGGTSSTDAFLNCVRPEYAVLSCGVGNEMGYPAKEAMERLEERKVKLFRTDMQGTVEAISDGSTITWNLKPCNDFSWRE